MNHTQFARSPDLLSLEESLLFLVDLQEKLLPYIAGRTSLVPNCVRLIRAAQLFDVPVVVTEQYPKGLGKTVSDIVSILESNGVDAVARAEKLRFSGADATGWMSAGERQDSRHQVVLIGIETHICILQTALDLLSRGYRVYVVVDAVGSRYGIDHEIALARLRDSGATVTTAESVLFEWCETAESEKFKTLRDLVATR